MCEYGENHDIIYDVSALDVALRNEQIDCAHVLLENGANIKQESAVCHAVSEGKKETLDFLLKHFPNCAKHIIENERKDLLHVAVEKGQCPIAVLLLDAGADVNYIHEKKTPLMVAYHHEMIELLLKRGCNVNMKTETTVLMNVMSKKYIKHLRKKLELEIPDEGNEYVDVDCFPYLEEFISILLRYGANVNGSNEEGKTPLIVGSCLEGAQNILKMLVDHGADINYKDREGNTALHWAVIDCQTENVKVLLELGADVNVRDVNGSSALHKVVSYYGRSKMLSILLQYDVDVNIQDNKGNIPLMMVSRLFLYREGTTKALVQAGSRVNHRNKSGKTAFMLYSLKCDCEGIQILYDAGADIHATTSDGSGKQNALSLLLSECFFGQEDCLDVAEFLLDHGVTARYVNPGIIHRAIAWSHSKFVLKLIQGGLAPQDINLEIFGISPTGIVSPLSVALFMNDVKLARCLIDIWYLTLSDVDKFSKNMSVIKYLEMNGNLESASLLRELQPMSLTLLSFVVVSNLIGVGKDREERIIATQLPWVFKEHLHFRNVRECLLLPIDGPNLENTFHKKHSILFAFAKHCPVYDGENDYFVRHSDSEMSDDLMEASDSDW